MQSDTEVLVVGGGPAGITAACTVAEAGQKVRLCDSAPALGGAIYRGASGDSPLIASEYLARWREISARLNRNAALIQVLNSTSFVGLDSVGVAVLKSGTSGDAIRISPRGVIIATGAVEKVRPVPGWHHPGVVTAGGLQVNMKSSGSPPDGNIVIAGNGPLLLAVAAQLATLGNPPVVIVESGKPLLPRLQLLGLPFAYIREAFSYLLTLRKCGVRWIHGAHIERIDTRGDALSLTVRKGTREQYFDADVIALHDGLQSNVSGMPCENLASDNGVIVLHAGDCNEALGARAAPSSGEFAANRLLAALQPASVRPKSPLQLHRQARAQARIASIFKPMSQRPLASLPDDTIVCRCEQKTIGDLRRVLVRPDVTAKEIKLNGRFAMGRCQGRFCAKWTLKLATEISGVDHAQESLVGNRWPACPISIGSLARLAPANVASKTADANSQNIQGTK